MKNRYQTIPRTLCLIINHGKVLLIEFSKEKGTMQGFFNCPGGHIEAGEGILQSAKREILEETGLQVTDTKLKGIIHITNFFGKNIMLFVTMSSTNTKTVKESKEGALHWIELDKLNEVNLIEDVELIIEKINKGKETDIFSATSEFSDKGKLLKMQFEK